MTKFVSERFTEDKKTQIMQIQNKSDKAEEHVHEKGQENG